MSSKDWTENESSMNLLQVMVPKSAAVEKAIGGGKWFGKQLQQKAKNIDDPYQRQTLNPKPQTPNL